MPEIRQIFIGAGRDADQDALERKLYVIRKRVERSVREAGLRDSESFYVPSLSCRTIVYKGLLLPEQIPQFYVDLVDPTMTSALALVHQRFSTNTFPSWDRAHPYRFLAHNGEINTLRGNVNWMRAREKMFASPLFGDDIKKLCPIIDAGRQRLGDVRQRARAAGAGRPLAAARRHDDDPRGVAEAREHERREARVLRVPRLPDGAVGRPGVDRLHRRHASSAPCSTATACGRRATSSPRTASS